MTADPGTRASVADRERAQRELLTHLGTGRIDLAEFEIRSAAVAAAGTRAQLAESFADLPAGVPPAPPEPGPLPPARLAVLALALACLAVLALRGEWLWLTGLLAVATGCAAAGWRRIRNGSAGARSSPD